MLPQADLPWPLARPGILARHNAAYFTWASTHCGVRQWILLGPLCALPLTLQTCPHLYLPLVGWHLVPCDAGTSPHGRTYDSGGGVSAELGEAGAGGLDRSAKLTGEKESWSSWAGASGEGLNALQ